MAEGQLTEEQVKRVLAEFKDPETGRDIVQLEQVHGLRIEGRKVSVTLGLTTFSAPLWKQTQAELAELLEAKLPGPVEVSVELAVHERPAEKLGEVGLAAKSVIAVASGKGGVGKSTIATVLACQLARAGSKVGLMDADIFGPSIPHLLGTTKQPVIRDDMIQPIMVDGLAVMSMGFLAPAEEAVIWRGPMLHGVITQFLRDTNWGELDYLIVDLPPGTGDIVMSLTQLIPLSGAVVVCTPQDVALLDATKAVAMFRHVNVDILGVVENMSHFICPDCDKRHDIFGSGGAKRRAGELKVPFLGEVPLNMQLRIRGDAGTLRDILDDDVSGPYLREITTALVRSMATRNRAEPPKPTLSVLK